VCRKFTEVERREIFLLQYIENDDKEKKPLSPLADARAWRRLIDDYYDGNLTQAAKMRGRSKGEVSNRLSLLKAADEVVEYIQKNNITDPATYAALGRLWKHSANKAKELMEQHESGELKGSFRSALEECSKAFSKKKAGQGACDPNDFGGGESGSEEANQTLDLLVTNATEKTLKNIAKAAKILAKANETAVDGQSSDEIMIKELSKAMNAIKSAINDYKKGK
jgi:ParB-like chromosome segregation protein Spo0J